ncbi:hypothetical protein LINGRAHAP2_LOCUS14921 [Linum grandiflorum]
MFIISAPLQSELFFGLSLTE